MKSKIMIFVKTFLFLLLLLSRVNAKDTCSYTEKNELASLASNVVINYVSGSITTSLKGENIDAYEQYFLDIKIYGMNSKLRIVGQNHNNGREYKLTYRNVNPDDKSITIRQDAGSTINNYTFSIYGSVETNCYSNKLRTIKITLPMYNYYSMLDICSDIQDYYLCNRFIATDISKLNVEEEITKYKEKLAKVKKEQEENNSVISKTVLAVSKNKYWIAGFIIIFGIIITILIIRRRSVL